MSTEFPNSYWHCAISIESDGLKGHTVMLNDLTFDQLQEKVIKPWHSGEPMLVEGLVVEKSRISKVQIVHTAKPSQDYEEEWDIQSQASTATWLEYDTRQLPFKPSNCRDYTKELL